MVTNERFQENFWLMLEKLGMNDHTDLLVVAGQVKGVPVSHLSALLDHSFTGKVTVTQGISK